MEKEEEDGGWGGFTSSVFSRIQSAGRGSSLSMATIGLEALLSWDAEYIFHRSHLLTPQLYGDYC